MRPAPALAGFPGARSRTTDRLSRLNDDGARTSLRQRRDTNTLAWLELRFTALRALSAAVYVGQHLPLKKLSQLLRCTQKFIFLPIL